MDERDVLAYSRTAKGRAHAVSAIRKATAPPTLDLSTLQRAHSGLGKAIDGVRASDEEFRCIDVVVKTLQPKPPTDDVALAIFSKFRDGTVAEQDAIRKTLIRMGEVASAETQPAPLFSVAKTRASKRLGGLFV
jgi:hypothetical protein